MSGQSLIEDKISSIQKYLDILTQYQRYSQIEIQRDVTVQGAVERYLYLLTQSTIDLAEMLIARKKLRKPATLSESFEILHEAGVIDAKLQEKMIKLTGFRNILAHDYTDVDYDIVYDVLQHRLADITEFTTASEA